VRWPEHIALILTGLACLARSAAADPPLSPITDRHYAIDLYEGFALGGSSVIALGGAGAADAMGSAGTLLNPSAPAVRQTTDHDAWSWDYHLDYLYGSLSTDYDNAQLAMASGTKAAVATGGLALRVHDWAGAVTLTDQSESISMMAGSPTTTAEALHGKLAIARWFADLDLALGLGLQAGQFDLKYGNSQLFTLSGAGLEAGAQWLPRNEDFRLGVAASTPVTGTDVKTSQCDPTACDGYILPSEVYVPWRMVAGAAYRRGETSWNQQVKGPWRDEHELTFVADLVVTGSSPNAYGLQAFGQHELERSGRHLSWSPRGGVEYEIAPGRVRARAGSYWEPGRFDGVPGRLHGTFGIEVGLFEFELWGPRRGELAFTGDLAPRYRNIALSIGFWH
jgi:hypothetical protein